MLYQVYASSTTLVLGAVQINAAGGQGNASLYDSGIEPGIAKSASFFLPDPRCAKKVLTLSLIYSVDLPTDLQLINTSQQYTPWTFG